MTDLTLGAIDPLRYDAGSTLTSPVTVVEGREGCPICDPLEMVTLTWLSKESQTPGLPQRMANRVGDQWDAL